MQTPAKCHTYSGSACAKAGRWSKPMIMLQPSVVATISATNTLFCHGCACWTGRAWNVAKCCSMTTEKKRPSSPGMRCQAEEV